MRRPLCVALVALALLPACAPEPAPSPPAQDTSAAPPPAAPGETLVYADPNGQDDGDGSEARPFSSLEAALEALVPGDTLVVAGGEFRERIVEPDISPAREDAPIRVVAAEGEQPVVRGLLWLDEPSHWHLQGINVTWDEANSPVEHMVKITGGEGWSFTAAELWGARSFAAMLVASTDERSGGPWNWVVARNCIHGTVPTNGENQDHLLYVNTSMDSGSGTVEGNLLFDAPNGEGVKLGGPDSEGGSAGVVVRFNTVDAAAQSLLLAGASRDNRIERNVLSRPAQGNAAIRLFQLTGEGNEARDNLLYDVDARVVKDEGFPDVFVTHGTVEVDPDFAGTGTCDGYAPQDERASEYGHTALPPT